MTSHRIQRILVATDTSDSAAPALRLSDNLRQRLGCRVTVVYANEPFLAYDMFEAGAYASVSQDDLRQSLERRLREHVSAIVSDPDAFDLRLADGHPAEVIRMTAEEIGADLIVMGTHGRTGLRRALLGSIAERVVHESTRAVLTVTPAAAGRSAVTSILCPVNFTNIARQTLDYASSLARELQVELIVVHVADEQEASLDPSVQKNFSPWVEAAIRERCRYAQLVVRRGRAAEEVLQLASERRSMIVIGAQHQRFSDATVIGTTTEQILRFATQPVLTVIGQPGEQLSRGVSAA